MIEINALLMRKCKSDKPRWGGGGAGYKAAHSVIYEDLGKCKFTMLDILTVASATVSHTQLHSLNHYTMLL
jgi:hypothetical protein